MFLFLSRLCAGRGRSRAPALLGGGGSVRHLHTGCFASRRALLAASALKAATRAASGGASAAECSGLVSAVSAGLVRAAVHAGLVSRRMSVPL